MSAHGSLTLWDIEQAVLGLSEVIESPDTTEEEKQAARGELERWVQTEIKKIDRVRGFLRHCAVMEEAAKFEAMAMSARAKRWGDRARRLKELCISAMQASGVKRLEGQSGVLRIQNAGGKQALKITREDLLPDEYCDISVTFRVDKWRRFIDSLDLEAQEMLANSSKSRTRNPNPETIRKALETKCKDCGGLGRKQDTTEPCAECRGSGRTLVPGAELEPRSVSLRVE